MDQTKGFRKRNWFYAICFIAVSNVAAASDPTKLIVYLFSLPLVAASFAALITSFANPKAGIIFSGVLIGVHIILAGMFYVNLYAIDSGGIGIQMIFSIVFIIISIFVGLFKLDTKKEEENQQE